MATLPLRCPLGSKFNISFLRQLITPDHILAKYVNDTLSLSLFFFFFDNLSLSLLFLLGIVACLEIQWTGSPQNGKWSKLEPTELISTDGAISDPITIQGPLVRLRHVRQQFPQVDLHAATYGVVVVSLSSKLWECVDGATWNPFESIDMWATDPSNDRGHAGSRVLCMYVQSAMPMMQRTITALLCTFPQLRSVPQDPIIICFYCVTRFNLPLKRTQILRTPQGKNEH